MKGSFVRCSKQIFSLRGIGLVGFRSGQHIRAEGVQDFGFRATPKSPGALVGCFCGLGFLVLGLPGGLDLSIQAS